MDEAAVVEPVLTEWASPVVYVPKKGESQHFCVQYRRLNEVTIRDSYTISRMKNCIDPLGEAQIFINLDANSRYLQIEMVDKEARKTATITYQELLKFSWPPFELDNVLATLHGAIAVILASEEWQNVTVYIDDIYFFLNMPGKHLQQKKEGFHLLYNASLTIKRRTCFTFNKTIDYLLNVTASGKLHLAQKITEAMELLQ